MGAEAGTARRATHWHTAKPVGVYRPRRPRASALYRLIEDHFEEFATVYDERFALRWGHALHRDGGGPAPPPPRPNNRLTYPDDHRSGIVGLPGCADQRSDITVQPGFGSKFRRRSTFDSTGGRANASPSGWTAPIPCGILGMGESKFLS